MLEEARRASNYALFYVLTEETRRRQYLEEKKKIHWETDLELHSKFLDRKVSYT